MIRNTRDIGAAGPTKPAKVNEQCMERTMAPMPLDALRDAKQLTQTQMAQLLKISQGAVSKVERRNDMFISTLRNYVRAIGGDLQIRAVFPDGDVLIEQFWERESPRAGASSTREEVDGTTEKLPLSAPEATDSGSPEAE